MKSFKKFLLEEESPFLPPTENPSSSNYDLDPHYRNLQVTTLHGDAPGVLWSDRNDYIPGIGNLSMWFRWHAPSSLVHQQAASFFPGWHRNWHALAQNWFYIPVPERYERYNTLVSQYFERLGPNVHPSFPPWPPSIAVGYNKDGTPICQEGECYSENTFPPNMNAFNPWQNVCPPNCPTGDGRVYRDPINSYFGGPATQGGTPQ